MDKVYAWMRDHSLSLIVASFWIGLTTLSWFIPSGWFADRIGGAGDSTFGVMILVIFSKWFIERGSAESRE